MSSIIGKMAALPTADAVRCTRYLLIMTSVLLRGSTSAQYVFTLERPQQAHAAAEARYVARGGEEGMLVPGEEPARQVPL